MASNARFERDSSLSPDVLWAALTDVDRLGAWFDQLIDYGSSRLEFAAGSLLLFVAKDDHLLPALNGRVIRYEPPRLLEYTWGADTLRWQVAVTGRGCRLILTVTRYGPGPVDRGRWEACLDRLDAILDGGGAAVSGR